MNKTKPNLGCRYVQSVLVPKGGINDKILMAHEIISKFNTMKGEQAYETLKLDMKRPHVDLNGNLYSCT